MYKEWRNGFDVLFCMYNVHKEYPVLMAFCLHGCNRLPRFNVHIVKIVKFHISYRH